MSRSAEIEAIRQRVAGWRAAERRERELRRAEPVLDPAESLAAALELCELVVDAGEDAVRVREVERTRRAWMKLREHFACRQAPVSR